MPIYEYECEKCGAIEEVFQKFSDAPLDHCKSCSGKLHKLISQNSFHLKGGGWYVTDYAKSSGSSSNCCASNTCKSDEKKSPEPAKKAETVKDA